MAEEAVQPSGRLHRRAPGHVPDRASAPDGAVRHRVSAPGLRVRPRVPVQPLGRVRQERERRRGGVLPHQLHGLQVVEDDARGKVLQAGHHGQGRRQHGQDGAVEPAAVLGSGRRKVIFAKLSEKSYF